MDNGYYDEPPPPASRGLRRLSTRQGHDTTGWHATETRHAETKVAEDTCRLERHGGALLSLFWTVKLV